MATYYVRADGNNANAGTGYAAANAWATIAKAISVVAAGDTVYIAPGTYREVMTIATSGTNGNLITWWGDKEARYFTDMNPGYVRVTGCAAGTELASQTATIILNIATKGYNAFRGISFDGVKTGNNACAYISSGTYNTFTLCIFEGTLQLGNGTNVTNKAIQCIASGGNYGFMYGILYNCITIGSNIAYYNNTNYNCIAIGGMYGFNTSPIISNCTAIGCYYGFSSTGIYKNCNALNCNYGFSGNSGMILQKCKSINCQYAFYGTSSSSLLNITEGKYSSCISIQRGSGFETGTPTDTMNECYFDISKLLKLATALRPDLAEKGWSTDLHSFTVTGTTTPLAANNDYVNVGTYNGKAMYQSIFKDHLIFFSASLVPGWYIIQANATTTPNESATVYAKLNSTTPNGTYTNVSTWAGTTVVAAFSPISFAENYDILTHPRRMGDGVMDCGAFEYSDVALSFTEYKTSGPSIQINRAGVKRIVFPVKKGVEKTVSAWVKFSLDGGTNKPQLIIQSTENILTTNPTTVTATGTGAAYELLTTTFTPVASGFYFVDLLARETGAGAVAYFSDLIL